MSTVAKRIPRAGRFVLQFRDDVVQGDTAALYRKLFPRNVKAAGPLKWAISRARAGSGDPIATLLTHIRLLKKMGAPRERGQMVATFVQAEVDALWSDLDCSHDAIRAVSREEALAESAQNVAQLLVAESDEREHLEALHWATLEEAAKDATILAQTRKRLMR